jgi:hypothetical protein
VLLVQLLWTLRYDKKLYLEQRSPCRPHSQANLSLSIPAREIHSQLPTGFVLEIQDLLAATIRRMRSARAP